MNACCERWEMSERGKAPDMGVGSAECAVSPFGECDGRRRICSTFCSSSMIRSRRTLSTMTSVAGMDGGDDDDDDEGGSGSEWLKDKKSQNQIGFFE